MISLYAEAGLQIQDVTGWSHCRRVYEESTGMRMSIQNNQLSERLRIHQVPHQANAMVPTLEGFRNAGVRGDIVIEAQRLVIEVEGPQRMCIPLAKLAEQVGDKDLIGKPEEVLSQALKMIECYLTGSASWKRRLLRRCGWQVVTLCFDENYEYIADVLERMKTKNQKDENEADQDSSATISADARDDVQAMTPEDFSSPFDSGMFGDVTFDGESFTEATELSEFEIRLRERHSEAVHELRRRIVEERGNAAATGQYSSHLEYRMWQVGVERTVLRDMLATL